MPSAVADALLPAPRNPAQPPQGFWGNAGNFAYEALGLGDVAKALRGQMTDTEAQDFLFGAALGVLPAGRARVPELWHGISKIKLPRPVSEMQATYIPGAPLNERVIDPAALQGSWLLPAIGDRSAAGTKLAGVGETKLRNPVEMQGGHGFMPANAEAGAVWASAPGVVSRLGKVARALSETAPVHFPYTAMGERSIDFSHHVSDTLSEMLKSAKLSRSAERAFNKAMKTPNAAFGAVADWPGIASPNLRSYLVNASGDVRNKFAKAMDTATFQDAGFPSVAEARYAVTDPRLLNVNTGDAGLSIGRLDPSGATVTGPTHNTYKANLAGTYVGGLGRSVPKEVFYPDLIQHYTAAGYPANQHDYLMARGLRGAPVAQKADQKWVDTVSQWLAANP